MSKKDDIDALLDGKTTPTKGKGKPAAKTAEAKPAAPAKKAAAKTAAAEPAVKPAAKKAAPKAEATEKPAKEPVRFAAGEREAMYEAITAMFKPAKAKPMNSKDLAAALAEKMPKANITTRKLRPVLYAMAKKAEPVIALELAASKVLGMTVSRA